MIEYVKMEKKHLDGIAELEKECFSVPWSKKSFAGELDNKIAHYIVAVNGKKVVGYGGFWQIINQADITNIAVLKEYRRQGIATEIIRRILKTAEEKGMMGVSLEVRISNDNARSLYLKMGFEIEGIRKEYYEDTKEDALVMWKYF